MVSQIEPQQNHSFDQPLIMYADVRMLSFLLLFFGVFFVIKPL